MCFVGSLQCTSVGAPPWHWHLPMSVAALCPCPDRCYSFSGVNFTGDNVLNALLMHRSCISTSILKKMQSFFLHSSFEWRTGEKSCTSNSRISHRSAPPYCHWLCNASAIVFEPYMHGARKLGITTNTIRRTKISLTRVRSTPQHSQVWARYKEFSLATRLYATPVHHDVQESYGPIDPSQPPSHARA